MRSSNMYFVHSVFLLKKVCQYQLLLEVRVFCCWCFIYLPLGRVTKSVSAISFLSS